MSNQSKSISVETTNTSNKQLLDSNKLGNTDDLSNMSKYEIITSLEMEIKEGLQSQNHKLEGYLKKFEFYTFCDKFADFTNSYERMQGEVQLRMESLYDKISAEVKHTVYI